jgi:putative DNA primase/helicase
VALEGDPGMGKSSLVAKIIAHVTTGKAFPTVLEGTPPLKNFTPQNVCLLTSEDDPADTLVPRIVVNGGDVSRVFLIDGWEQPDGAQGIVTLQDLALLQDALERYNPALLVFAPPAIVFWARGGHEPRQ